MARPGHSWSSHNEIVFVATPTGTHAFSPLMGATAQHGPINVIHLVVHSGRHSPLTAPPASGGAQVQVLAAHGSSWKRWGVPLHRRQSVGLVRWPWVIQTVTWHRRPTPAPDLPVGIPAAYPLSLQDHIRVNSRLFLDGNVEEPVIVKYIGGTKFNKKGTLPHPRRPRPSTPIPSAPSATYSPAVSSAWTRSLGPAASFLLTTARFLAPPLCAQGYGLVSHFGRRRASMVAWWQATDTLPASPNTVFLSVQPGSLTTTCAQATGRWCQSGRRRRPTPS